MLHLVVQYSDWLEGQSLNTKSPADAIGHILLHMINRVLQALFKVKGEWKLLRWYCIGWLTGIVEEMYIGHCSALSFYWFDWIMISRISPFNVRFRKLNGNKEDFNSHAKITKTKWRKISILSLLFPRYSILLQFVFISFKTLQYFGWPIHRRTAQIYENSFPILPAFVEGDIKRAQNGRQEIARVTNENCLGEQKRKKLIVDSPTLWMGEVGFEKILQSSGAAIKAQMRRSFHFTVSFSVRNTI